MPELVTSTRKMLFWSILLASGLGAQEEGQAGGEFTAARQESNVDMSALRREKQIYDLIASFEGLDAEERLEEASEVFVGARYALSPLGEGRPPDSDPRIRFDAFDCTTYVETVVAMALSRAFDEVRPNLDSLRYRDGSPSFEARHHLPVAQWIPAFTRRGLLIEATRDFGAEETRTVRLRTSPELWRKRTRARALSLEAEDVPTATFEVDYVPIDRASQLLAGSSEVLLLNVVRSSEEGSPIVVTHQALLFPADGGPRVRHASSVHGGVVEMTLSRFVADQALARKWPVLGLNVQRWSLPSAAPAEE